MKYLFQLFIILFLGSCARIPDYTQWVDPFIGTLEEGHCFPGATVPMGMAQPSPESWTEPYDGYGMDHVAGYQYSDPWILGFTQTHLNGAGCPSMSDILLMPFAYSNPQSMERSAFKSAYSKSTEVATPGYYSVYLTDSKCLVELTATPHVAFHKYTFNPADTISLLVDLQYGVGWDLSRIEGNILSCEQRIHENSIDGYRVAREWAERKLYYTIEFNRNIIRVDTLPAPSGKNELAPRYILHFVNDTNNVLEVKIALSTTSVDAAKQNLRTETVDLPNFEAVRSRAKACWNEVLSKIDINDNAELKKMFYTSLYHLYIQPNNIADVDGRYRAADDCVYSSTAGRFYSTLSLWDTYRAAHPMYTLLSPSLVPDLCASILDHYARQANDGRYLPRWALWGKETNTMIGNHAIPVLVDAWLKGLYPSGYNADQLYEAIYTTATEPHYRNHTELINKYGYIPYDLSLSPLDDRRETVSRLLEGAYDDYCVALLSKTLEKKEDEAFFAQRSKNYRNVYDSDSGFMRGRNARGLFKTNVDVNQVVGEWVAESDFTEGNAWHYLFHVQHNIDELIDLIGGEKVAIAKLDSLFNTSDHPFVKDLVWKIDGTIGQYWHGNEPCHHVPYLYKYTKDGYKTDRLIHRLVRDFNKAIPDGLKGNDDCGQMSAWYMFAVLGFYPVNPCGGEFILGAPQVQSATIRLENGREFHIEAQNISDRNIYVKDTYLNGRAINCRSITYQQIMQGGRLVFVMGS